MQRKSLLSDIETESKPSSDFKNNFSKYSEVIIAAQRATSSLIENTSFKVKDYSRILLASIAEAAGRDFEFEFYFAQIGSRMRPAFYSTKDDSEWKKQGKTNARNFSRKLKDLEAWQGKTGIWFVEVERGKSNPQGEREASKMTVNFHIFNEIIKQAKDSDEYSTDRKKAFEKAAKLVISREVKRTVHELPPSQLSDAEKKRRADKTFDNLAEKFYQEAISAGKSLEELDELDCLLFARLTEAKERAIMQNGTSDLMENYVQNYTLSKELNADENNNLEVCDRGQIDTQIDSEGAAEIDQSCHPSYIEVTTNEENEAACVPPTLEGTQKLIEKQSPEFASTMALTSLMSVGVSDLEIVLIDDTKPRGENKVDYFKTTTRQFWEDLPKHLDRALLKNLSFIARPRGANLIQIDDADENTLKILQPFSFLSFETSPGNYQAWLAFDAVITEDELVLLRDDLLRTFKKTKGNGGSYGAMRFPGSINAKPQHNGFQIRIVETKNSFLTSRDELNKANLLTPEPVREKKLQRLIVKPLNAAFPDYDKCLQSKSNDRSKADASFITLSLLRGFDDDAIAQKLLEVSERAREEEKARRFSRYFETTLKFCRANV